MIIKWLKHGEGKVKRAIDYLLNELNHRKEKRDEVVLLRGDPSLLITLGDILKKEGKKNIYRSAVIGFHPDDQKKLNTEVLEDVLNEFEKCMVAYAGVPPDRIPYIAVYHREGNNTHIHIVVIRTDLETGKDINPSPPGWERVYGLFRRYIELKYGFVNTDERRRPVVALPEHIDRTEWFKLRERIKEEITKYVMKRLGEYLGAVTVTRQTIVEILGEIGEVVKVGKDYIHLKIGKEVLKLKGGLYDEDVGRYLQKLIGRNQTKDESQRREYEKVRELLYSELRRIFNKTSKRFGGADESIFFEFGEADARADATANGKHSKEDPSICREIRRDFKRGNKKGGSGEFEIHKERADTGRSDFAVDGGVSVRCDNGCGVVFNPEMN